MDGQMPSVGPRTVQRAAYLPWFGPERGVAGGVKRSGICCNAELSEVAEPGRDTATSLPRRLHSTQRPLPRLA